MKFAVYLTQKMWGCAHVEAPDVDTAIKMAMAMDKRRELEWSYDGIVCEDVEREEADAI